MRYGLRFGLRGPPVVYDTDGGIRPIGGGKMRSPPVALLLEPGRVVSVDALKDALWGGAPPASAQASLQNHVTRFRRVLGRDGSERLRAVPPGYLLRVEEGELDVRVFEDHVTTARAAHAGRDWDRAVREASAALALWRGAPLSGLPLEAGGRALVQRLEETWLLVLEWWYDAELHLGGSRLTGLVPELAALVAEHPLREGFHRLLMLVLHRTGRPSEALAVHRDLRERLIEELGAEPGGGVREAHLEVLRDDRTGPGTRRNGTDGAARIDGTVRTDGRASDADVTGASAATPYDVETEGAPAAGPPTDTPDIYTTDTDTPGTNAPDPDNTDVNQPPDSHPSHPPATPPVPAPFPRPAQLPCPPANFTGRTAELDGLLRFFGTERDTPRVAVLSGMAGVGKSALALHVAYRLRERFSDGQLYVHLHGATPGMTPLTQEQALAALLRDLGSDPHRIPEHPDAAAALLRSLLAPTRTLLVLDDAANAAPVRPLLPGGPGCAVIVTSRSPLTALDGAHRVPLAPLSDEDSAALLRAVSGRDGLDAGHPLVELAGRLPLALRVVAARLAARRAVTPDVLAGQLAATEGRLHHLEYDDLSVRRSLVVAHDALHASDREADRDGARVLGRIGALDLPRLRRAPPRTSPGHGRAPRRGRPRPSGRCRASGGDRVRTVCAARSRPGLRPRDRGGRRHRGNGPRRRSVLVHRRGRPRVRGTRRAGCRA